MALNASAVAGGGSNSRPPITPLEPGSYPARVVSVIDLGVQAQPPYQGQEKLPVQKVALTYEFVDEFVPDENGQPMEDKPRWLTETFPFYNLTADKAKSTLRYKALDPKNEHGGDFSALVGTPCMVTVVHNPGKGSNKGRIYEKITEVTSMRPKDAAKCPPLVNPPRVFDFDEPDLEVYQALPPFIQKQIQSALNFNGSKLQALLGGTSIATPSEQVAAEELDDENPY